MTTISAAFAKDLTQFVSRNDGGRPSSGALAVLSRGGDPMVELAEAVADGHVSERDLKGLFHDEHAHFVSDEGSTNALLAVFCALEAERLTTKAVHGFMKSGMLRRQIAHWGMQRIPDRTIQDLLRLRTLPKWKKTESGKTFLAARQALGDRIVGLRDMAWAMRTSVRHLHGMEVPPIIGLPNIIKAAAQGRVPENPFTIPLMPDIMDPLCDVVERFSLAGRFPHVRFGDSCAGRISRFLPNPITHARWRLVSLALKPEHFDATLDEQKERAHSRGMFVADLETVLATLLSRGRLFGKLPLSEFTIRTPDTIATGHRTEEQFHGLTWAAHVQDERTIVLELVPATARGPKLGALFHL